LPDIAIIIIFFHFAAAAIFGFRYFIDIVFDTPLSMQTREKSARARSVID
jgi:hypothetical protein